jgi:catechol 2,3-dioxygenase-like lactoylglutathione lyase family enzyme
VPITKLLINARDIAVSVDFYTQYLGAILIGEQTVDRAVLDLLTARLELTHVSDPSATTWIDDDHETGFRHIGFKVAAIDELAERLKAEGIAFRSEPFDADGGVRICFFYDPDGTHIELVQGQLEYREIRSESGVAAERALGIPSRPRFDHVAVTVASAAKTEEFYAPLGFERIGHLGHDNPDGFELDFLKSGNTVLEVFSYAVPTVTTPAPLDARGFVAAQLEATEPPGDSTAIGTAPSGEQVYRDTANFHFTIGE